MRADILEQWRKGNSETVGEEVKPESDAEPRPPNRPGHKVEVTEAQGGGHGAGQLHTHLRVSEVRKENKWPNKTPLRLQREAAFSTNDRGQLSA